MDSPTKSDTLLQTEDSPVSQSITVDSQEETKVQGDGITGNNTKRPKRQRSKGKNSKETQMEDVAESEVLYQVLDSEHKVADKNGVAVTVGDVEFKRIKVKGGKSPREHELWFRMERYPDNKKHMKPPIKVFVDIKVKRVSDIDAAAGTYRMRFHIFFNWLMSEDDFRSYLKARKEGEEGNWEPEWYPKKLMFQNKFEEITKEWEEIGGKDGVFRMMTFKTFGQEKDTEIPEGQFDSAKARFIRAKLECDMTFIEELELQSVEYP